MNTLHWVATPHPDTPHIDNECSDDYDEDPIFPACRLLDCGLPAHVENQIMEDMTYWQAETLASNIESRITQHEESDVTALHDVDDEVIPVLESAVEWLRYWSSERKSVYAAS